MKARFNTKMLICTVLILTVLLNLFLVVALNVFSVLLFRKSIADGMQSRPTWARKSGEDLMNVSGKQGDRMSLRRKPPNFFCKNQHTI
jgi:hypothetical protein